MYRIRFHGRGGQGMRTAGRILGRAFFLEGFEVQDAPRYGAERRGAPIFAYVRAAHQPINERGIIQRPDLVIVADETLIPVPAAGITLGCHTDTVVLIKSNTPSEEWRSQLKQCGPILTVPDDDEVARGAAFPGASCVGAAARLLGVISQESLRTAIRTELAAIAAEIIEDNVGRAVSAFEYFADHHGLIREGPTPRALDYSAPRWTTPSLDPAEVATPAIRTPGTTEKVQTGLWRTLRPVIDRNRCNRCWWICSTFCPDSAIRVSGERFPEIDYDHCKGCLICVNQCPARAIDTIPEDNSPAQSGGSPK